jgi:hypothetical protein
VHREVGSWVTPGSRCQYGVTHDLADGGLHSVRGLNRAARFDSLEDVQNLGRLHLVNGALADEWEYETFQPAENVLGVLEIPGGQELEVPLAGDGFLRTRPD